MRFLLLAALSIAMEGCTATFHIFSPDYPAAICNYTVDVDYLGDGGMLSLLQAPNNSRYQLAYIAYRARCLY